MVIALPQKTDQRVVKSIFLSIFFVSFAPLVAVGQAPSLGEEEKVFFADILQASSPAPTAAQADQPTADNELTYEELKSIGYGVFSKENFNLPKQNEKVFYFNREKSSLIHWEEVQAESWTNLQQWIAQRDLRDAVADWEMKVRATLNHELMGRVLSCIGECRIYRGKGFAKAGYRSSIREGDDLSTGDHGHAWVFLLDGTMVRLSPKTTVSFKEINIGRKENFLHARINEGHVAWLSRQHFMLKPQSEHETDVLFLPLKLWEANREQKLNSWSEDNFSSILSADKEMINQYNSLNQMIIKNNIWMLGRPTYSFLVMPNGTVFGRNLNMEIYYNLNQAAYIKNRSNDNYYHSPGGSLPNQDKAEFYYRGHQNTAKADLENGQWYEVASKGREITAYTPQDASFELGELLGKRIPTIFTAREMLLEKYSKALFLSEYNEENLARFHGYKLWGPLTREAPDKPRSDLELRLAFLKEFTRRLETSNLLSQEKYLEQFPAGKAPVAPTRFEYTAQALTAYLNSIGQSAKALDPEKQGKIWRFRTWKVKNAAGN